MSRAYPAPRGAHCARCGRAIRRGDPIVTTPIKDGAITHHPQLAGRCIIVKRDATPATSRTPRGA